MSDIMDQLQLKARDNGRTPMQWDSTNHGGFTTGKPWMRVNDEYPSWNASLQTGDDNSVYSYWTSLLKFRRDYLNIIVYGNFKMLTKEDEAVLAYRREGYTGHEEGSKEIGAIVVVLNFQPTESRWNFRDGKLGVDHQVLLGNYKAELKIQDGVLILRPFETVVFSGDRVRVE